MHITCNNENENLHKQLKSCMSLSIAHVLYTIITNQSHYMYRHKHNDYNTGNCQTYCTQIYNSVPQYLLIVTLMNISYSSE